MENNSINELISNGFAVEQYNETAFGYETYRYNPHVESLDANARRIYEGTQTNIKFFPFIAAVQVFGQFYCAGSIIAADLIITAASCLQLAWNNSALHENPGFITVRVGSSYHASGGEVIPVKDIHFHPDFDPANLKGNLCILRLRKKLLFDDKVKNLKRIKFDEEAKRLPISVGGLAIIGWGAKNQETASVLSDVLSYAVIDIFKFSDCQDIYSKDYVREENFCAGFVSKGGGACGNDVGDPGLVNGLLTGIVSFGSPTCGARDAPTVFIKLGYFAGWIYSVINMKETTMKRVNYTSEPSSSTTESPIEDQTEPSTEQTENDAHPLSTTKKETIDTDLRISNIRNLSLTVQNALRSYFGNDEKMYKAFLKTCQEKDIRLFANLLGVNTTNQTDFSTPTKQIKKHQKDYASNASDEINSGEEDDENGNQQHHQKQNKKSNKRKHRHHVQRSKNHKSKTNKAKFRNVDSELYSDSELSLDWGIDSRSNEPKESKSVESKPIIRHEILDLAKKFISDFQNQNANINKKGDSEEVVDDIIEKLKTNQYNDEIADIFKVLNIPTNIEYDKNKNENTDSNHARNVERFLNALELNGVVTDNTTLTSSSTVPVERKIEEKDEGLLSKAVKYLMTWVS